MVKVLNEKGIIPDIITVKSKVKGKEAEQFYGENIDYNLREILFDIKLPADFHILYFNLFVKYYLKKYSLIINSSNSSFLLPNDINLLSYIHYPRKDRLVSDKLSIHFPDGENKNWFKFSHSYHNAAKMLYRLNTNLGNNEKIIANSDFTKRAVIRNYPEINGEINIIYPPVWKGDINTARKTKNYKMICSLGRFAEDKRQIEQLYIADKLPGYQFHIMGFAKEDDPYFIQCKKFKEKKNLRNVFLHPTVDFNEMNRIFDQSGFFIHSIRNEPFGIVTVEAIARGCVPVVHNSGGQKEIVNIEKLRYNDIREAVALFQELAILNEDVFNEWIKTLSENSARFSYSNFREEINYILKSIL